jgi:hypothetical protein
MRISLLLLATGASVAATSSARPDSPSTGVRVFYIDGAHDLPARELRRYAYLLTNRTRPLPQIEQITSAKHLAGRLADTEHAIVLLAPDAGDKFDAAIADVLTAGGARSAVQRQIDLCTVPAAVAGDADDHPAKQTSALAFAAHTFADSRLTLVTSGIASSNDASSSTSALTNMQYAVFTVAERWGARFNLHGDVLPDFTPGNVNAPPAPSIIDLVGRLTVAADKTFSIAAADPQFACVHK